MSENPRHRVPNEVSPDELRRDDGTIDARALHSGRCDTIGAKACADSRRLYRQGHILADIADRHGVSLEGIRKHVRGGCSHEHDVDPIESDD